MRPEDYARAKALITHGHPSKRLTLKDWAKGFATFNGGKAKDWVQAYQDHENAAEKDAAKESLRLAIDAYPVPKRFLKILHECAAYGKKYNAQPRIDWELAEDGLSAKATLITPRTKRKRTQSDGETKGRKSAWVAYQEGQEMQDTFTIERTGKKGIFVDLTDSLNPREIDRKDGGLCAYIRRVYPNSDAAKILYKFGYDRLA